MYFVLDSWYCRAPVGLVKWLIINEIDIDLSWATFVWLNFGPKNAEGQRCKGS